ncbi:GlsB/YeaQ/YmgE family stress response membrane protein [Ruminococcaceae bacterium OttesenSCG-928-I18]|nr:GlsB/YeaQ/YmgE family stress response membrane protein [Ruminococcaceae bacterium OttesenSCG-928-I18]
MGILSWILVGALAGWLAGLIVKCNGIGMFMSIVVGVVGAFIGGLIMNLFGRVGITGFSLWSLLVAVIGAILLLSLVGLLNRSKA